MTNENLKVGDCPICDDQIVLALSMIDVSQVGAVYRDAAVELIKYQQSRIELLESAIREHENVNCELAKLSDDDRMNERNSAKYLKSYYAMISLIKPNGE